MGKPSSLMTQTSSLFESVDQVTGLEDQIRGSEFQYIELVSKLTSKSSFSVNRFSSSRSKVKEGGRPEAKEEPTGGSNCAGAQIQIESDGDGAAERKHGAEHVEGQ